MGNQLILEWSEAGGVKTHLIDDRPASKNPGTVRIGRDPSKCDIVLANPTVSGLHIEIFFNVQNNQFWVRSLRESNPAVVDQKLLPVGEVALNEGSFIYLGEMLLKVRKITLDSSIPPTILVKPPAFFMPAQKPVAATKPPQNNYGLECPSCHRISPYERLDLGCPWCGTSLAAASSVVIPPS